LGRKPDEVGVEVRPAVIEDLPALIEALGQRHYFTHHLSRADTGKLIIATWRGAVLGAAFLRLAQAEEWELRQYLRNVPILSHVEVVEGLRNQGVGTMIMDHAEELARAKGRSHIALGVTEGNLDARRLYERLDYHEWDHGLANAIVVDFAADGGRRISTEKCHIMVKALDAKVLTGRPYS
jgi:GNAT superfamily N-acetyltransferase